jgi:LDH2 family malate/lactate/ureidoglycolate dehydrogenase
MENVKLAQAEARELAMRACLGAGADRSSARSLVNATLSAALFGQPALGFPHMLDYLISFQEGRISPHPKPSFVRALPAFLSADADGGIAQLGFDRAFLDFVEAARTFGIAVFSQGNSYPAGELGYFVRRLADVGLAGIAATNANAMLAAKPGGKAVFSTNPIAFGFPLGTSNPPLVIDQSSSATAYVNIVAAATEGREIPEGWAVDDKGADTRDPLKALAGSLLPSGGRKGANLALMVEMLSAGLSGGNWSIDAGNFNSGNYCPAVGLTIIAITPDPTGSDRVGRALAQVQRLQRLDVYVPGVSSAKYRESCSSEIVISRMVHDAIRHFVAVGTATKATRLAHGSDDLEL